MKLKNIFKAFLLGIIVMLSYQKTVQFQAKTSNIDRFYNCVQSKKQSGLYTTMNQIECDCNKELGTHYGE